MSPMNRQALQTSVRFRAIAAGAAIVATMLLFDGVASLAELSESPALETSAVQVAPAPIPTLAASSAGVAQSAVR